jgi:hypothetical protein
LLGGEVEELAGDRIAGARNDIDSVRKTKLGSDKIIRGTGISDTGNNDTGVKHLPNKG